MDGKVSLVGISDLEDLASTIMRLLSLRYRDGSMELDYQHSDIPSMTLPFIRVRPFARSYRDENGEP